MWTGHIKGLVRVRQKQQWDHVAEDKAFTMPVRCIAFDEHLHAWIGDDSGKVKVMRCDDSGKIENVSTLQRSTTLKSADSASKPLMTSVFQRLGSGGSSPKKGGDQGPIRCIIVRDKRAWVAGGNKDMHPYLVMFDADTFKNIDTFELGSFGPCYAMKSLPWPAPNRPAADAAAAANGDPLPMVQPWRLLTGHENGQLLLWNPEAPKLQPMLKIHDSSTPIRYGSWGARCTHQMMCLTAAVINLSVCTAHSSCLTQYLACLAYTL